MSCRFSPHWRCRVLVHSTPLLNKHTLLPYTLECRCKLCPRVDLIPMLAFKKPLSSFCVVPVTGHSLTGHWVSCHCVTAWPRLCHPSFTKWKRKSSKHHVTLKFNCCEWPWIACTTYPYFQPYNLLGRAPLLVISCPPSRSLLIKNFDYILRGNIIILYIKIGLGWSSPGFYSFKLSYIYWLFIFKLLSTTRLCIYH